MTKECDACGAVGIATWWETPDGNICHRCQSENILIDNAEQVVRSLRRMVKEARARRQGVTA